VEKRFCDRPGCHRLFTVSSRIPRRRFCSPLCSKALRQATQREKRWRGVCRKCPLAAIDRCDWLARGP
jgi:predicted RNA-binding Zn ribbon-like protein